jgi:CheY-like chemotaxis protein
VLINLALNARDAMPTGGTLSVATADVVIAGDGSAATSPVPPGAYATLAVGDTGTGMTPEVRERIFEPFFTTKPVGRGSGLGLPTAYGVIQQSGGHIVVDSTPGRGSIFTIYLPRIAKRDAAPPTGEPERRPGRGAETILLVEDEAAVRRLARRILERQGYSVLEAEDGHRALALARAHDGPLDLLITDMVMPGLSGRALAERLTTERRGLRVLFMSGYTDDEIVRRGLTGRHTTIDLLEKPFTADVLLRAARAVLEGRRLQPA